MRKANLSVAIVLLFGGCSARIEALEQETRREIKDLRQLHAESTVQMSQIRQEIRELQGQVEELQHVSLGKTRELEQSLRQLGSRVPPPTGVPEELLTEDEQRIATINSPAADLFRQGLSQLRAGNFEGSRESFAQFAQTNPGTAFTDNALFWLGINYIKLGRYDQAVVSFSDAFTTYPAEDMVPASLFYLAEAFEKMGSTRDAIDTLQKLIDEHSRSPLAREARTRVQALKRRR
ncbi:MAG: tetratricopeptide repeat protein [Bdellovibrionales bacterium]|nr:tetratricopeptide repeat protein [Bdellovibrionales bacterium]